MIIVNGGFSICLTEAVDISNFVRKDLTLELPSGTTIPISGFTQEISIRSVLRIMVCFYFKDMAMMQGQPQNFNPFMETRGGQVYPGMVLIMFRYV